jgi:hypothetical protein
MPMLNPEHLLQQAARLIEAPQSGPARQVDIRRAMSASYYAIFHLVLIAAADSVVGRVHRGTPRYGRVYRSIEHKDLKTLCDIAQRPSLPASYQPHAPAGAFGRDIQSFAKAALWLQGLRHTADYDPGPRFHTTDASNAIAIARSARKDWQTAPNEQKEALLWLLVFRPRP